MTIPRLIIVAGPAGSGKTTWAGELAYELVCPTVHTDSFLGLERAERVTALLANVMKYHGLLGPLIVEGCESLRFVAKMNEVAKRVDRVIWIDGYEKPGTAGLTTQQRKYLEQLKGVLPPVEVVPGKPKEK